MADYIVFHNYLNMGIKWKSLTSRIEFTMKIKMLIQYGRQQNGGLSTYVFTTPSIWVSNERAWLVEYCTLWQISNLRWPPAQNARLHICFNISNFIFVSIWVIGIKWKGKSNTAWRIVDFRPRSCVFRLEIVWGRTSIRGPDSSKDFGRIMYWGVRLQQIVRKQTL